MTRAWHNIPIKLIDDPLIEIPPQFFRIEPHPYYSLGAPYGNFTNPWMLRSQVINRLKEAEKLLFSKNKNYRLAIFDAWRPITVQEFMVNYVITKECSARGIKSDDTENSQEYIDLVNEVERFWAPPSLNPLTPPPHSTGGAIDLTIADFSGPLNMGGEIDDLGDVSSPNYYDDLSFSNTDSNSNKFRSRRKLLNYVMTSAGFAQHPNEWWHFSFGDQLWAFLTKSNYAVYGSCTVANNSVTN